MISLFLALCIIIGCGFIIGNAVLILIDRDKYLDRMGDRALLAVWLGILLLSNLFLGVSLFLPLSPFVALYIVSPAIIISLCLQQNRASINQLIHIPRQNLGGVLVPMICVSIAGTQIIHWYDSGLYHIQVIKWLAEFGLVPGLALIHSRFGFISSWFTFAAPFYHGSLAGRVASLPGSFCMLMLLLGWTFAFFRVVRGRGRGPDWFMLTASSLASPLIVLRWIAISPSPDLAIMVLVIFVGWALVTVSDAWQHIPPEEGNTMNAGLIPLLLSAGAVTIKLSAIPLLAVSFLFYLFGRQFHLKVKNLTAAMLVTLALLLPLTAAGIVTSGCALYPAPFFCTDLPWSLGHTQALTESRIIAEWARWNGPTPDGASSLSWIVPWLQADKIYTLLILLTCISTALVLIFSTARLRDRDGYIIAIGILGTAFMSYKAPTWRFGLGYLFIVPALLAAILHNRGRLRLKRAYSNMGYIVTLSLIGLMILFIFPNLIIAKYSYKQIVKAEGTKLAGRGMNPRFHYLLPPKTWNMEYDRDEGTGEIVTSPVILQKEHIGGITYYRSADGEMCWDAPLPCAPAILEEVQLRNQHAGIAGGFVRTSQ